MLVRCTTNPGLEDVAAQEITSLLDDAGMGVVETQEKAFGLPGVVTLRVGGLDPSSADDRARVWAAARRARSVYHVVVHVTELEWDGRSLASLEQAVGAVDLDAMAGAHSFRVSCSRTGEHDFHSPDAERAAGTVLQSRYGTAVDLEGYDVNVRVDIVGVRGFCGYQLTGRKGLDRRYPWQYHPRVTLRTPAAYAMLRLAGYLDEPGPLHDPFCGSGTILLEAATTIRALPAATPALSGSDWDERAVVGARQNADAAGVGESIRFLHADARELSENLGPSSLAYIVTNPPFGIRMARDANLQSIYDALLREASVVLRPGGTLAVLVGKRRASFNRALRTYPRFTLTHVRVIELGGVFPGVFILRQRG